MYLLLSESKAEKSIMTISSCDLKELKVNLNVKVRAISMPYLITTEYIRTNMYSLKYKMFNCICLT